MQLEHGEYWVYLRKSRADLEAEARGEGETLAKHEKALYKLAKELNILITREFREVESGEFIAFRPEMKKMLELMPIVRPKGVLCMDIDRLGRGDKIDQGIIEKTFKECRTLIITPGEIFDLNNESGEFGVEVRSFLARMELKQINKRLQGGRIRSVEEGNYIGTRPPYGYKIQYDDRGGRMLVPHPEQAQVVKMIFEWYTHPDPNKRIGTAKIARKLNDLHIPTYTGKPWEPSTVNFIIKNAVYAGRIQWRKKQTKKSLDTGKKKEITTRPRSEWIDVKGKHEPLVDEDTFNRAQEILKGKYHVPYQLENGKPKISTSLAGLIKCAYCGATMVYRPYKKQAAHLRCNTSTCTNKSSRYEFVENKLIQALEIWLHDLKVEIKSNTHDKPNRTIEFKNNALHALERELKELEFQRGKLFDLLERGIYSEEIFMERSKNITERILQTTNTINSIKQELELEKNKITAKEEVIPKVENVIMRLKRTKNPLNKNQLFKSILQYAVYKKEQHQTLDDFTLIIKPRI